MYSYLSDLLNNNIKSSGLKIKELGEAKLTSRDNILILEQELKILTTNQLNLIQAKLKIKGLKNNIFDYILNIFDILKDIEKNKIHKITTNTSTKSKFLYEMKKWNKIVDNIDKYELYSKHLKNYFIDI